MQKEFIEIIRNRVYTHSSMEFSDITVLRASCNDCGELLPVEDFCAHGTNKYGINYYCRECMRIRHQKSRGDLLSVRELQMQKAKLTAELEKVTAKLIKKGVV